MDNRYLEEMDSIQLSSQVEKIETEYKKASSLAKKRKNIINYIAEKICDFNYATSQLGGPNRIFAMSDIELRDFIVENFYSQKKEMAKLVQDLQKLYQEEKNQKEEFGKQVLELQKEVEQLKLQNNNPLNGIHRDYKVEKTDKNYQTQESEFVEVEQKEVLIDGNQVFDIRQEMNKIDLYQEELIKVIGEYGYSEAKQIYAKTMEHTNTSETTLKTKLPDLEKLNMLEKEDVSTFLRKRLALYGLTPLGQQVYKELTGKNPVIAEKDVLKRQHATLQHAYCIKDTATILEGLGYTDISIDSSKNQIQVAGGSRYVPDITAMFSNTEKTFWEVELAHHKDNDFFEKINKAAKVTNTLYIIADTKESFDKLKRQVGRYQAYLMKNDINIKLTIFLGTMNQLKQRNIFTNPECRIKIG